MVGRSIVLFATLLAATGLVARQNRPEPAPARSTFSQFPMQIQDWRGQALPPLDRRILAVLGVDDYMNRYYSTANHAGVGLYVGFYNSQRQGDSIHSPLNCLPGAGWEPLSRSSVKLPVALRDGPVEIDANRYVIQKGLERQRVLYWDQSHGRTLPSADWTKVFLIPDPATLNRHDAPLAH